MYYEFSEFYKRDVYFVLNQELSGIDYLSLLAGQVINPDRPLVFNVDRIDSYIEKYDVLPTFSTPLVSARFKNEL